MPGLGLSLLQESGCSVCAVKSDRVRAAAGEGGWEGGGEGGGGGGRGGGEGRGGRGGGGRGGGGGEGGEGGTNLPGFWCSPPTDSPNPLEEAKLHRRTLGVIYGFTQRHPPPPPRWWFGGVGVSGEGIKRWGIEGIRIGTSDRFGRGRGEF